jgi:hypothetical protein
VNPKEEDLEKEKIREREKEKKKKEKKKRERETKGEWYPAGELPPPPGTLMEERRHTLTTEIGRTHKGAS